MCGIIGQICLNKKIDIEKFNGQRDTMRHRGPDGFGTVILNDGNVALGHRRLSIIDLSESGHQPMSNEDGTIWLTFNGEIYNYADLRKKLISKGHIFKSTSDSEVLIHGYEEWGINNLLQKINGMFAFAIWDQSKRSLILARDRFGIKPLFYSLVDENFIFASELKAIHLHADFDKNIDWSSAFDFLVHRFIPNPKSIWESCSKLEPAHYIIINQQNQITEHKKYWKLEYENNLNEPVLVSKRFNELLEESVFDHMISDVPVGVFLSGGYDSSSLVKYMSETKQNIKSFSIGFKDWKNSEHLTAKYVSEVFGTLHHERVLDPKTFQETDDLSYYYDEPQGGSSFLPTFQVCEMASNELKVVISGDGGDELLGGYKWHNEIISMSQRPFSRFKEFLNLDSISRSYWEQLSWTGFRYSEVNELFNNVIPKNNLDTEYSLYQSKIINAGSVLKQLQTLDIEFYLADVFLPKLDRASMAHSLEVRVPFLDHRIFEFIFQLHPNQYFDSNETKFLLKNILKDHLSKNFFDRPKQGFGFPMNQQSVFPIIINSLKDGRILTENIVNRKLVNTYIERRDFRKLWALFLFNNWYTQWM